MGRGNNHKSDQKCNSIKALMVQRGYSRWRNPGGHWELPHGLRGGLGTCLLMSPLLPGQGDRDGGAGSSLSLLLLPPRTHPLPQGGTGVQTSPRWGFSSPPAEPFPWSSGLWEEAAPAWIPQGGHRSCQNSPPAPKTLTSSQYSPKAWCWAPVEQHK